MHPGHGAADGRHGGAKQQEDEQQLNARHRDGDPYEGPRHVQELEQLAQPDLQQVQHQHRPGINREDAGKEQEVRTVELCGAVQNLAEREGAEVAFHLSVLWESSVRLPGY